MNNNESQYAPEEGRLESLGGSPALRPKSSLAANSSRWPRVPPEAQTRQWAPLVQLGGPFWSVVGQQQGTLIKSSIHCTGRRTILMFCASFLSLFRLFLCSLVLVGAPLPMHRTTRSIRCSLALCFAFSPLAAHRPAATTTTLQQNHHRNGHHLFFLPSLCCSHSLAWTVASEQLVASSPEAKVAGCCEPRWDLERERKFTKQLPH